MKFVVPFNIAEIESISFPSNDSINGFKTWIPPPTEASNFIQTPFSLARLTNRIQLTYLYLQLQHLSCFR